MWNKWLFLNTFCGHLSSCYQVYILSGLPDDPEWAERLCRTTRGHRWESHHSYHLWADTLYPGAESREEIGKKKIPFPAHRSLSHELYSPGSYSLAAQNYFEARIRRDYWYHMIWAKPANPWSTSGGSMLPKKNVLHFFFIPTPKNQISKCNCWNRCKYVIGDCHYSVPHSQGSSWESVMMLLTIVCRHIQYIPGMELGQVSRSMDWEHVDPTPPTNP